MPQRYVIVFLWLTLSQSLLFCFIPPVVSSWSQGLDFRSLTPQVRQVCALTNSLLWRLRAACFHWKFQVDSAKFLPRKLACKLSLKWVAFDKCTHSNKMENSMLVLYLQKFWFKCSAVVSTTSRKWEAKNPNPTSKIKRKITCEPIILNMPRALWSASKTKWQVTLLSKLHAHFWWTKQHTVLVSSHLYLSGVPLQLIIRSLDPAASDRPTDLSHISFCFQNCLSCLQFSLFWFPVPLTKGYLLSHWGTCMYWHPETKFYVRRIYWERVSMDVHSPPNTQLLHIGFLLSIFLLSCLTLVL